MLWNFVGEYINFLDADCIAGAHHSGDIVRIKYIFQYNCKIGLSFI